jgi:murein DD-endopeptidase MepM/ murein hydrolase activator NlpD
LPPTTVPPAVQGLPAQIQQGGTAVVVLNQSATAATLRFNGLQFPMIQKGDRWWTMVGVGAFADLGPYNLNASYTGAGSQANATVTLTVADKLYPVENIDLDAQTSALLAPSIVANELARRASIYALFTPQKLWTGPWVRPHPAELSDIYGIARGYNGSPPTDYHRGTDFAGQKGTPIVVAAAGKVAFAEPLQVRGNSVIVDHGVGVFSAYHHLSRIDVSAGQDLNSGQQVGLLGDTGLVTGPHLHWEVVVRGVEVDGLLWLDGREWGL